MDQVEPMRQAIKQKLLDLEIDPTQPIDEKALVRATGASLTIVTQALDGLTAEGYVTKQRGRFHVARASMTSVVHEISEVRNVLEGMCARLAAERVTPEQVARMEQAHREFERVIKDGDNRALIAVDRKFHQALYEASGNRFLARALDDMYALIVRLYYFALDRIGSVRANVEEHRAILDAVKAGDGRNAERLIQEHIAHFQKLVEGLI
jgi:DNA-binding GntR family transcriptional regulator